MKYVPRNQMSTIQDLIYPRPQIPMTFFHHKQNLLLIKETQEKNKKLQEEREKYVPPEPYKLKQFTEIPSSLEEKTKEWIKRESELRKLPENQNKQLPPPTKPCISPYYNPYSLKVHSSSGSLFERYYAAKLKQIEQEKDKNKQTITKDISNEKVDEEKKQIDNPNASPNIHGIRPVKKEHSKSPVPNNSGLLLPKINHNFLYENRKIISEGKVPKKYQTKEEKKNKFHKNFGKTPEYLAQYKLEEERRKEYQKLKEEEKTYPKGTKLVSEEERLKTLQDLIQTKKEIETILEKMPITQRSLSVQTRREELLRRVDEIDKAIEMFSKKRVFIRAE